MVRFDCNKDGQGRLVIIAPIPAPIAVGNGRAQFLTVANNSPSLAVVLNCGIGSSSLNAKVKAFERLQKVWGLKTS